MLLPFMTAISNMALSPSFLHLFSVAFRPYFTLHQFSSVQFSSVTQLCPTVCNPMHCSTPGLPVHHQLLEFTQTIELVMPSSHLILCCPLLLLPPILPSIRDFSNESTLHMRWPKYWSFIFSISPSNEHPGLISFKRSQTTAESSQGVKKSKKNH